MLAGDLDVAGDPDLAEDNLRAAGWPRPIPAMPSSAARSSNLAAR